MPINSEKKLHLIHKSLGFRGLLEISKYIVKKNDYPNYFKPKKYLFYTSIEVNVFFELISVDSNFYIKMHIYR